MAPCLDASLRTCLEGVSVPAAPMLFLVLTAVIGGADTWAEAFEQGLCPEAEVGMLREDTALMKLPLYQEAVDKDCTQFRITDNHVSPISFWFNPTPPDETWRLVAGNRDFRRAVDPANNNPEIVATIYFGIGTLPEISPGTYDPDQAHALLDSIGMDQRDDNGWRLAPNEPFSLPIEYGGLTPDFTPMAELLIECFTDVGITTTARLLETSLLVPWHNTNEVFATMPWDVQPMWEAGTWTDYTPLHSLRWRPFWNQWGTSNGEVGEEPPAAIQRLIEVHPGRGAAVPAARDDWALTEEQYPTPLRPCMELQPS